MDKIKQLEEEIARLKAEVARLSDPFLHAPDYMEWFAVDKTGDATWWNEEPFPVDNSYWEPNVRIFYSAHAGYYPELAKDWKNSKIKRVWMH